MEAIKQAYLMWVGAKHYPTIDSYCAESFKEGVSKRVPGLPVAEALMEEGAVVFVAHDEGEYEECPKCKGVFDCETCAGVGEVPVEGKDGKVERAKCEACEGSGKQSGSSGGSCIVDGKVWRYRRLLAMLKNPKLFKRDDHTIEEVDCCDKCGGTGRIPKGMVFGVFVPERIEYILKPEDDKALKEKLEKKKVRMVTLDEVEKEKRRGCGFRKSGGYYLVTEREEGGKSGEKVAADLVKRGLLKPEAIEVRGNFVRFLAPVDLNGTKRFRGVKKWSLDPLAAREAEFALDAME